MNQSTLQSLVLFSQITEMFVTKSWCKTSVLLKLRLFSHSFFPKHTPYDNEKNVGMSEQLNHGEDMC